MHTSPMNVESSSFDQRFLKVNDSAVESSQVSWLQSPSLEEKKQNNTWHSATFQYHLARGTSQRGGRREAAFINVAFYRIRYGCAYTANVSWASTLTDVPQTLQLKRLSIFNLGADVCFWSGQFWCVSCIPPGRMKCLHREAWAGTKAETQTVTQQPIYRFP